MISNNDSSVDSSDLESASIIDRGTELNADEEETKERGDQGSYPFQMPTTNPAKQPSALAFIAAGTKRQVFGEQKITLTTKLGP